MRKLLQVNKLSQVKDWKKPNKYKSRRKRKRTNRKVNIPKVNRRLSRPYKSRKRKVKKMTKPRVKSWLIIKTKTIKYLWKNKGNQLKINKNSQISLKILDSKKKEKRRNKNPNKSFQTKEMNLYPHH